MISVIIPYMPVEPYDTCIKRVLSDLEKQTADIEVIVSEQNVERYINLNRVKNEGIKKSSGEIVWFCNADYILNDPTFIDRMYKKLFADDLEVILPMYLSPAFKKYKVTDGTEFVRRDVLDRYGPFDESLVGIAKSTFVFLNWCLENTRWHASKEFVVILDHSMRRPKNRIHYDTFQRCKEVYKEVVGKLEKKGLWLNS